jgi:phosphatidylinositol dimannoside acyltransferase
MSDPATAGPVQAPHAPLLGSSRRFLGRLHITGVFWFKLHRFGVVSLPEWTMPISIVVSTGFFFLVLRGMRRAVTANLEAVLGPAGFFARQGRIWSVFWNQAWCNSERFERLGTTRPFRVDAEGTEHWYQVAAGDKGFILATAHVGSWDVGTFIASEVGIDRHVHIVREQEMDARAQEFVSQLYKDDAGSHFTTHFARDNPQLGPRLLTALRKGDLVGLQSDRPATSGRVSQTKLFDRPFPLPVGPAALARAAEVPIVPVFCFREGRRHYRLDIRPPIPPTASLDEIMASLVAEIEGAIRQRPRQWFCFRKLW